MVLKRHLTPIGRRGTITKQRGKGSSTPESDPMGQLTGRYPKPEPVAPPDVMPTAAMPPGPSAPAPMGMRPPVPPEE